MTADVHNGPVVAFIGLGAMGFAMSTHLVRQGIKVVGFDIWKPTVDRFEVVCQDIDNSAFAVANSPADAVRSASIILLMVATHTHINSALFGSEVPAVKSIPKNGTIIIASTIPPTYLAEVRSRLDVEFSRTDIKLIDAPVSGGVVGSANGTLTVMASSNNPQALEDPSTRKVLSLLSSDGKKLYSIPGSLGAGSSTKALNQVQCSIHVVAASEIMALAASFGLDTNKFYERMRSPSSDGQRRYGWTWMFEDRGVRMLNSDLPISSAIAIFVKDAGIIKAEESRLGIDLDLITKTYDRLLGAEKAGMTGMDDAWINRFYLGFQSARELLVIDEIGSTRLDETTFEQKADMLLLIHAMINFQSAYETFQLAEALDLLSVKQRQIWFKIIAGAAGASRVFSEVIPLAFDALSDGRDWKEGFVKYAKLIFAEQFGDRYGAMDSFFDDAKNANIQPILSEAAYSFVQKQLSQSA